MNRYGNWKGNVPSGIRQGGVERALAVAFQVERDIKKAGFFQSGIDGRGHFGSERARQFVRGDFDARKLVMESNTKLLEAEVAEGGFGAINEGKALRSDFGAVGKARGKAGGSGAIPRRQIGATR